MMEPTNSAAKARAAVSSAKRNVMRASLEVYRIENETVTMTEMARRVGISKLTMQARLKRLRGASGAITWKRLGLDA